MISAAYIAHSGDDLMVVNSARVSFAKLSTWTYVEIEQADTDPDSAWSVTEKRLAERDAKLIRYLADHSHWTPFSHPQITLHIRAPIFVARQAFKSKVGFTENEVSRRYVDSPPEFYMPLDWRGRPTDRKQGSSEVNVVGVKLGDEVVSPWIVAEDCYRTCRESYEALIEGGVAPEQARMVLPQAMLTEWYWTGSLAAWARFCKLRLGHDAQAETGDLAAQCGAIIAPLFPVSWAALRGES